MDPQVVVDASVWAGFFIPQDVHHASSLRWVNQYIRSGGRLVVPMHLLSEVAGAISRRTGLPALAYQAVTDLMNLAAMDMVAIDRTLAVAAAQVAMNFRLRGADAIYVALAQSLNIPLITWDAEQQQRTVGHITTYTPSSYVF